MSYAFYFDSALAVCVPLLCSDSFFRSSPVRFRRRFFFFRSRPDLALSPFLSDMNASFVNPVFHLGLQLNKPGLLRVL
jgi:hypothetical protein